MLCNGCEKFVEGTFDRREIDNPNASIGSRRSAAIRVLAMARRRCVGVGGVERRDV